MKIFIAVFLCSILSAYENTLSVWEIFPSSYTQEQIDFNISSSTILTAGVKQSNQITRYIEANGKAYMVGDKIIDNLAIFRDNAKTKFWCHYGFNKNGYIRDVNFRKMKKFIFYINKSTYTVEISTS